MANSRTNRLRAQDSGVRRGRDNGVAPHRGQWEQADPAGAARAARAAAEMADGMLLAAGAETAWHSREVERIALRIADRLGLQGEVRKAVGIAARLHDIGKVALPPALLQKPTAPTATEWKLIYCHTIVGERILRSVEELRDVAPLVRHSHERWDGGGYPDGLSGGEIPEVSRIVFCADAFHAICTDRPYRSASSTAAALAEVRRCAGTQFEPRIVTALTDVVRNDIYGDLGRGRRRSHARLSMLLMVAVTLGGSIAGGIAAGRDTSAAETIRSSVPLAAPAAPALETGARELGPDLIPNGGVAGAIASPKESPVSEAPAVPQAPSARSVRGEWLIDPVDTASPIGPIDPVGTVKSITRIPSDLGSRLGASYSGKGEKTPSLDGTEQVTNRVGSNTVTPVGATVIAPPPSTHSGREN